MPLECVAHGCNHFAHILCVALVTICTANDMFFVMLSSRMKVKQGDRH